MFTYKIIYKPLPLIEMNNNKINKMKTLFTILIVISAQILYAQSSSSINIKKSGTINLKEASKKSDQWFTSFKKIKKHKTKSSAPAKKNNISAKAVASTNPTLANNLIIGANFAPPMNNFALPLDDEIAVGNDGKVLIGSNRGLVVHDETGTNLANISWETFADDIATTYVFFDPRVIYDAMNDRFIVVILNGVGEDDDGNPNYDSRMLIGFSESNDPAGNFNLYSIEFDDFLGKESGEHFDYESIGISSGKLYIANNSIYVESIWKIDLAEGYAGNTSVTTSITDFVFDNSSDERGELFFIHNYDMQQNDYVYALSVVIEDEDVKDLALIKFDDNSNTSEEVLLNQDLQYLASDNYPVQPDDLELAMGERYFSGFIHNNKLTFSYRFFNATTNRNEVYLNDIILNTTNIAQSTLGNNMAILNFPNSGLGYIEMAPVGCDADDCDIILSLQSATTTEFLSSKVCFINRNNQLSTPIMIKSGNQNATADRVGDYIDIQKRYNKTDEVWLIGQYITNDSDKNPSLEDWVAKISTQESLSVNDYETTQLKTSVYPNPSADIVNIKISGISGHISIDLYDIQGKLIRHLIDKSVSPVEYNLTFNISHLQSGIYFLKISDQTKNTLNTKRIIKD